MKTKTAASKKTKRKVLEPEILPRAAAGAAPSADSEAAESAESQDVFSDEDLGTLIPANAEADASGDAAAALPDDSELDRIASRAAADWTPDAPDGDEADEDSSAPDEDRTQGLSDSTDGIVLNGGQSFSRMRDDDTGADGEAAAIEEAAAFGLMPLSAESASRSEDDGTNAEREEAKALSTSMAIVPAADEEDDHGSLLDPLQRYLREIKRHPLLTREEEQRLAILYKETGSPQAAYRLVTSNLRLVVKIANECRRRTMSLIDLIQEGNIGLVHAVQKFDPYRGVKLSSYAAYWIRAYILRYIMENFRSVKLGTTQAQRKIFFNLNKERAKLMREGRTPTAKLLADRLDVTEQEVAEMEMRMSFGEMRLDAPISEDDPTPQADHLVRETEGADDALGNMQVQAIFRRKIKEFGATLEGRDKAIFEERLTSEEPKSLQELGSRFGLTRERMRQIEAKLIGRMREWIRQEIPDFRMLEVNASFDEEQAKT